MDMYRAFLAILISFVILLGYQYFFVTPSQQVAVEQTAQETAQQQPQQQPAQITAPAAPAQPGVPAAAPALPEQPGRAVKEISVETDLYEITFSELGGVITSFLLKDYREKNTEESPGVQLVRTTAAQGYPLAFTWGSVIPENTFYTFDSENVVFDQSGNATITMRATSATGVEVVRSYELKRDNYIIKHVASVINGSPQVLQGASGLYQRNMPFSEITKRSNWLFRGPSYFNSESGLETFKLKKFEDGPLTIQSTVDWVAYQGTYFMTGIIPEPTPVAITMNAVDELVTMNIQGGLDTLAPGTEKSYSYNIFYGPKKLTLLNELGFNLPKIINFGWFDVIAKPMLYLLNWLYSVVGNYGISIILVTIVLKAVFWPITQKGLKSMKNMQKLQPKVVKLKEKYKNDPTKLNSETMSLYKTYKVNPLGGCLPMVLQIPVFFSLYKVLLQSIELRHAPFFLWITDLSAPDRLYLGFDLPYLGGVPVLTLLMGASMFLQQKMTPTTADPTQAKIMMFLPLIFTVMFVNFASGLVLYWFINNLLSILQQYLINRQKKSAPAVA
jgi:YidC/Oxa1 family membrane protein insertase